MAVTSLWRVHRNLNRVLNYVENPEKTQSTDLSDVLTYAMNSQKTGKYAAENITLLHNLVTGINCTPYTAWDEMQAVKIRFDKTNGTIAYHGYQSFAPGEATPQLVHEIGVKLAKQLWGNEYQVIIATHMDKENHLHSHFVINTVSFVHGRKFVRKNEDYRKMQRASDALCREYGLSVIEHVSGKSSKQYNEWLAEKEDRPTWRSLIRKDIDHAIRQSMTERQFFAALSEMGYEYKIGKDISVRPPKKERFFRLARNFGEEYTLQAIRNRILQQQAPLLPIRASPKRYKACISKRPKNKVTGFRALYYHYCYLMGIFKKKKPSPQKRLHFLLREDITKMESISKEARLLFRHHIDTEEQLSSYKQSLQNRLDALNLHRKQLHKEKNTVLIQTDSDRLTVYKNQISDVSKEIADLRKELRLCNNILTRSVHIKTTIQSIREENEIKEKKEHEHIQRRCRTDR